MPCTAVSVSIRLVGHGERSSRCTPRGVDHHTDGVRSVESITATSPSTDVLAGNSTRRRTPRYCDSGIDCSGVTHERPLISPLATPWSSNRRRAIEASEPAVT